MMALSFGVRAGGFAVLLPLVLQRLSVGDVNLWLLFGVLTAVLNLLDFGFLPTFVRFVAASQATETINRKDDDIVDYVAAAREDPVAVVTTMRAVYRRITVVATIIGLVAGTAVVVGPIAEASSFPLAWIAWGLTVVGCAVRLLGGQYSAWLQGVEQIALLRRWETVIGTIAIAAACLAVVLDLGLLGIVVATQTGAMVNVVVNRRLVSALSSGGWATGATASPRIMGLLWPAAWRSGLGTLAAAGVVQATGIVYAQIVPAQSSAPYLLALRLADVARNLANVFFYSKIPLLSRLFGEGELDRVRSIARVGMLRTNWSLVAAFVFLGVAGPAIPQLIDADTAFVSIDVWYLLGIAMALERIGAMHLQLYSLTNRIIWHKANGIAGLIALGTMVPAYRFFDLAGLPLAMIAGLVLCYVPVALLASYRTFELRVAEADLLPSVVPLFAIVAVFGWMV